MKGGFITGWNSHICENHITREKYELWLLCRSPQSDGSEELGVLHNIFKSNLLFIYCCKEN